MTESKFVPPNETVGEFPADYFDTPNAPVEGAESSLAALTDYALEMKAIEKEIAEISTKLAERQGRHDKLSRSIIPDIMDRLGMAEFKLTDGSKVSVKPDIKCGLTEERKPAAYQWLEETQNDGIIKTGIDLKFSRDQIEDAKRAVQMLQEAGFGDASLEKSIHPSTLKSFVKERIEAGDNIPLDTFGVFEFKQTKIVLPKTRVPKR